MRNVLSAELKTGMIVVELGQCYLLINPVENIEPKIKIVFSCLTQKGQIVLKLWYRHTDRIIWIL